MALRDEVNHLRDKIDAIIARHTETPEEIKAAHDEYEMANFTPKQLEHIFEQTRAALHLEGLDWSEASRLADRARTRVRGYQ